MKALQSTVFRPFALSLITLLTTLEAAFAQEPPRFEIELEAGAQGTLGEDTHSRGHPRRLVALA